MSNPQEMVCGFLFLPGRTSVLLIRKVKPFWMEGRLNGVGGKIEPGELPITAMVREFQEEAGVVIPAARWTHFAALEHRSKNGRIFFYHATARKDEAALLRHDTADSETLEVLTVDSVARSTEVLPNLKWLVPMALQPGTHARVTDDS